jgi:hypothetical protein
MPLLAARKLKNLKYTTETEVKESLTTILRILLIKSSSMKPEDTESVNEK